MLDRGRVDDIAYSYDVKVWNMVKAGIDPADYETAYLLLGGELGYAFNRDTDSVLLEQVQ